MGKIEGKDSRLKLMANFGVFAVCLLASFFAVYFYSPVIKTHAKVDLSPTKNIDINVGVIPEISLTVSSPNVLIEADINTFAHNSVDVMVKTNSAYGYTLAIEDADDDTRMVHEESGILDEFTSNFTGAKTSETLDTNTWGWSPDGGANYYFIPENGKPTLIDRRLNYTSDTITKSVDFGVKVGNVTSGAYYDTIIFTAYPNGAGGWPNEVEIYNKEDGSSATPTMQSFNCSSLPEGNVTQLKDTRDGNIYSVTKLRDGNCYMLENLRIVNKTLTPADSNVAANFVLKNSNLQDFVIGDEIERPDEIDAVYLNGNYGALYSWYTATAGSSSNIDLGTAEDGMHDLPYSICPAGWYLPSDKRMSYVADLYNLDGSQLINNSFAFAGAIYGVGELDEVDEYYNGWGSSYYVYTLQESSGGDGRSGGEQKVVYGYGYYVDATDNSFYAGWYLLGLNGLSVRCMSGSAQIPNDWEYTPQQPYVPGGGGDS